MRLPWLGEIMMLWQQSSGLRCCKGWLNGTSEGGCQLHYKGKAVCPGEADGTLPLFAHSPPPLIPESTYMLLTELSGFAQSSMAATLEAADSCTGY